MPDILYAAALDKQLYQDTQLTVATAQAGAQNTLRGTKNTALQCCICCHCCCLACIAACKAPADPGLQENLRKEPLNLTYWEQVPDKDGTSGWTTFCVQGVANNTWGNCGATCGWTVPSNVNCVQFDMWGPGAPSWGHECCGGSMYGSSGSFISTTVPTCAGDIWCLIAGCALCCNPMGPNNGGNFYMSPGAPTSVASCTAGINACWCAIAGPSNMRGMRALVGVNTMPGWCYTMGGCNALQQAGCWCSGGSFCMNGCATCSSTGVGMGAWHYRPKYCESMTLRESTGSAGWEQYLMPPMYGDYCWDTNFYGYMSHPPMMRRTANGSLGNWQSCGYYCMTWSSGNCCGGLCCGSPGSGYCHPPGHGGQATMVRSGTCRCGNAGKGGMVRVTYYTCS